MPESTNRIIRQYAEEIKKLYGNTLTNVILYGSYARGDNTEQSDIDIMILVNSSEDEIKQTTNKVSDIAFDYLMKYGIDISPVIVNQEHFNYWSDTLPFYRNVQAEGVQLGA